MVWYNCNMAEFPKKSPEQQLQSISSVIKSAYDLSSIGMGVQMHSLKRLSEFQALPGGAMDAVLFPFSNFITTPYVLKWGNPSHDVGWNPLVLCKETDLHRQLYRSMKGQYDQLRQMEIPEGFPEPGASFPNPEAMDKKLLSYFQLMKTAAAHKLAFMLAISDQLTFEAKELSQPISFNHNPVNGNAKWGTNWKLMFGEEVPGFGQLYENGYSILKGIAVPDSSLYAHILKKPRLEQLV